MRRLAAVLSGLMVAILVAIVFAPPPTSAAQARAVEPPLVILHADNRYDVEADGSYVQTYHFEFRPTNDASARREAQQAIGYSPSLEEFTILDAYVRKPDGRVLPVTASGHPRLSCRGPTPDLAMFSDQRQKVIVFPDAAGGDMLGYTWRRVVKRPAFPGQFMTNIYMTRGKPMACARC